MTGPPGTWVGRRGEVWCGVMRCDLGSPRGAVPTGPDGAGGRGAPVGAAVVPKVGPNRVEIYVGAVGAVKSSGLFCQAAAATRPPKNGVDLHCETLRPRAGPSSAPTL
ncbi:hypothetical protein GCM10011608_11880 [Micromonospora sonchi]|uniref:Uncharacterized protein n=1 Tax=Micromonospora sonchi TaxID=1763543 RepID=A0A917TPH6_9ACTN|nr:hypothetical protein GCM10011608_11880 [Micromonospora sonchi]